MDVIGKNGAFIRSSVLIRVLENDDLIGRLLSGIDMRVGRGATHPEASARVEAHLDGVGNLGELFFRGKKVHLETGIHFKRGQFTGRREPLVRSPALGDRLERGQIRVIDWSRRLFAAGKGMDTRLAVARHHFEIPHCGEEVEVAVVFVAVAGVVEGVERTVAPEILAVFIDDDVTQFLIHIGRRDFEEGLEDFTGKKSVARFV